MFKSIFSEKNEKGISLVVLAFSFCLGLITLYWGQFGDEADNLVVGNLLRQGRVLYRDVFSHHFPFPYYWMAIVIGLFGKSIFSARLSVLVFQISTFGISMKLSGNYLLVSVIALLWTVMRPFYRGHMVLYSSFAGIALLAILIIVLPLLRQQVLPDGRHWLAISFFSMVAFLSDPLTVYAVVIGVGCLFLKNSGGAIKTGVLIFGGLFLFTIFLLITNSYQAFWNDAILFNSQVYTKYIYTNPIRLNDLYSMVTKGLEITDRIWLDVRPFKPISGVYTDFERWIFTGFLNRFSIIICAIFLVLRKDFLPAIFLYAFAASTLIINKWDFRAQPFILVALVAISAIVIDHWKITNPKLRSVQKVTQFVVIAMVVWLNVRLMENIYINRHNLSYDANFSVFERDAAHIQEIVCYEPDVLLIHYPIGSYWYWFADLKPVSKYVFMWPWVAEIGLDEVVDELGKQESVIAILHDGVIWDTYDTKEYLLPLQQFIEENYYRVEEGTYMSPNLLARCPK